MTVLRALVAPFAWQSSKAILVYFTQNSGSAFLFGIGEQRPSFGNSQRHTEVRKLTQVHIGSLKLGFDPRVKYSLPERDYYKPEANKAAKIN